jgi:hypothetical protein
VIADQGPPQGQGRRPVLAAGMAVAAVLLVAVGCVAGRLTAPEPSLGGVRASEGAGNGDGGQAAARAAARMRLPEDDVPGVETPGLPRYPGSVRVDFDRWGTAGVVGTDADYLTADPLPRVQRFYRASFVRHGWEVGDVSFVQGEWSFLLLRGETEATVEIARRGVLVEVDIERSVPDTLPSLAETPKSARPGGG